MREHSDIGPRPGVAISAAIGTSVGSIVVGVWSLCYGLGLTPFPPFDLGDLLIRSAPGGFATWAIESLGENAQPLALVAGVVFWLLAWSIVGVAFRARAERGWARFVPLVMAPPALLLANWSESGLGLGRLIALTTILGGTLLGGGRLLSHWLTRLTETLREQASAPSGSWLDQAGDYSRRQLLRQIAGGAVLIGGGSALSGRLLNSTSFAEGATSAGLPLAEARAAVATPVAVAAPVPAPALPVGFDAPSGIRDRVTSNDEFYVVDISTRDPNINEQSWVLRVHGLVDRELLIAWPDLIRLPSLELDGTLMCISYEHDNGLISSTRWTGVPLRDVLASAGVQAGAVDVVLRGSNGYSDSIPLAKALEDTTLLAYGMNGTTLPRSHGFPCRLYVPGLYGEKHVKWLQEIELVEYDYLGFWQERGWTDIAIVNT
ncbi:MAG: molybdopterin-dependent oxidoreductase, partial [Vicinamibacterales bacterium]